MSTRTNWKAMQAAGARKPDTFTPPSNIRAKYMAMGSWRADASKNGAKRKRGG